MIDKIKNYTKTISYFVEIKVKSCGRTSCANESSCFRTFSTCKYEGSDKLKYYDSVTEGQTLKTTTSYYFTDIDNPVIYNNAMPYIDKIKILPTELRDDKVVSARANISLVDDFDPTEKGTFWKKFLARNPYYKGSTIIVKHGTSEDSFSTAKPVFTGIIDEISYSDSKVQVKCIDLLSKLNEVKLPLNNRYSLVDKMPKMFKAKTFSSMLNLSPEPGEFVLLEDYKPFHVDWRQNGGSKGGLLFFYEGNDSEDDNHDYDYDGSGPDPDINNKDAIEKDSDNNFNLTYIIIGYDKFDRPCDSYKDILTLYRSIGNQIEFTWTKAAHIKEYKVFRKHFSTLRYLGSANISGNNCSFTDKNDSNLFLDIGFPYRAERYYKFKGGDPKKIANWKELFNENSIFSTKIRYLKDYRNKILGDENNPMIPDSGYVKINKEVLRYKSFTKNSDVFTLNGVKRVLFDSEGGRYLEKEFVKFLFHSKPKMPGELLLELLKMAEVLDAGSTYVDKESFVKLDAEWQKKIDEKKGVKFSSTPIIDEVSVSQLFFDLVKIIDAFCWVGEDGRITIRLKKEASEIVDSPLLISREMDDSSNIMINSSKVSGGEKDVVTRYSFYWNRINVKEDISDKEAYKNWRFQVNIDAESEYMYNEIYSKELYSPWINQDCAESIDDLKKYVNSHLEKLLKRYENYRPTLEFSVDIKDYDLKTGDYIIINTDEFNTIDGSKFGENNEKKIFLITRRELRGNQVNLAARYCPHYDDLKNIEIREEFEESDFDIELYNFKKEVGVSGIKVHTFTKEPFFDRSKVDQIMLKEPAYRLPFNKLVIEWDNMFASTKTTAKYIDEFQSFEIPDPTIWKRVDKYHIYMHKITDRVYRDNGLTYSNKSKYERPNLREKEGEWIKIATIDDKHIDNKNYKYTYTVNKLDPGTHVSFFVAVSTQKQSYHNVGQEN